MLPAGRSDGGWEARRTWCLKAQRDALLAQGFSFNGFPGVDTSAGKSFTFARRKEGKVAPLFSGFKTASPPQNCEARGGTALLAFFFHESGGGLAWFSNTFLQPFSYCTAIYFCRQAVNQQLKPNPFLVGSVSSLSLLLTAAELSPATLLLRTGVQRCIHYGHRVSWRWELSGCRAQSPAWGSLLTPVTCRHHGPKPGPFLCLFCPGRHKGCWHFHSLSMGVKPLCMKVQAPTHHVWDISSGVSYGRKQLREISPGVQCHAESVPHCPYPPKQGAQSARREQQCCSGTAATLGM